MAAVADIDTPVRYITKTLKAQRKAGMTHTPYLRNSRYHQLGLLIQSQFVHPAVSTSSRLLALAAADQLATPGTSKSAQRQFCRRRSGAYKTL